MPGYTPYQIESREIGESDLPKPGTVNRERTEAILTQFAFDLSESKGIVANAIEATTEALKPFVSHNHIKTTTRAYRNSLRVIHRHNPNGATAKTKRNQQVVTDLQVAYELSQLRTDLLNDIQEIRNVLVSRACANSWTELVNYNSK